MPWSVKDVDSHKKGLSPDQKKKWVSMANSIYKKCMADGGSDKVCATKAIRIANSKFSEVTMSTKVKKSALVFHDMEGVVQFAAKDKDGTPKFHMVAYSGGIIRGHWYWGNLAIDLSGMVFGKGPWPLLEDHMTSRKIGFTNQVDISRNKLEVTDATFVDTPESQQFQRLSKEGFPYQASIYAIPSIIEEVKENAETEVNGYKFKGPGVIWRKCQFKEASVCTFGKDANTKSVALTEDEELELSLEGKNESKEEEVTMTWEEFKAAHPEEFEKLSANIRADVESKLKDEKLGVEAKFVEVSDENKKLHETVKSQEARLLSLEKQETLRMEKELKATADSIVTAKLSASGVPDRLWPKVRKQVSHEGFVKDGSLDVTAFSAAVDTEIRDWVDLRAEASGEVQGMGFSRSGVPGESEDVDATVTRLLRHINVEPKAAH